MREYLSMFLAFVAIFVFVVAVIMGFLMQPMRNQNEINVGEQEISDDSITSAKIEDGTITDSDISFMGISRIAKHSVTLEHLSKAVFDALMGISNFTIISVDDAVDNSIDGSLIMDNTITDAKISMSGISRIANDAINSDNILDGSVSVDDLSSDVVDLLSGTVSGNVLSGNIVVSSISYSTPRTHYYSVGGEHFQPLSNIDFASGGGCGGAYLISGSGALVAPVNLPDGATVTGFKVFFYDVSSSDMSVSLNAQNLKTCSYVELAKVKSDSDNGYYNRIDSSIDPSNKVIDNQNYAYHIKAYSDSWSSSLKIKGAVISYTIDEVE